MIAQLMTQIASHAELDGPTVETMMEDMLDGHFSTEEIAALLAAMTVKRETVAEITACARVMRRHGTRIDLGYDVMDIVGTGGDNAGTFNISTTAALVAASAGIKIAKHGNRAASSQSGAADLLEQLGAKLDLSPEKIRDGFAASGFCFFYAPCCHQMSERISQARRTLGVKTIFNLLGPLTNPAGATTEMMGVYRRHLIEPLAEVLVNLGVTRGIVLCGNDEVDEATLDGPTFLRFFHDGSFRDVVIRPEDAGLKNAPLEALRGGTPSENAEITRAILSGRERGARRDAVLLNAGLAILLAGKANTLRNAVRIAADAIDSGRAEQTLYQYVETCQ